MKRSILFVAIGSGLAVGQVLAQEPVIGVANAGALLTSPDPATKCGF